jgi:hypothetical protein
MRGPEGKMNPLERGAHGGVPLQICMEASAWGLPCHWIRFCMEIVWS